MHEGLAAARIRLESIDLQIAELERSILSLRDEKNVLQSQLVDYIYPVLTLPNEIVSEIFVRFLPAYPELPPSFGPLSPTLLSQKWRGIALSTPALWRAVSVPRSKEQTRKQRLSVVETFLARSGSCIRLECRLHNSDRAERKIAPFIQALLPYSARWEHLRVLVHL
ncbi:hypothetical protein DFH07DRAFT_120063 [Mycena maculata]|uniref:F-box domain-containing protein n=1 Tax=Mycena maculata TaxID=230809 RepID=A0AAD7I4D8_9AGAR|nr:hypothetical protein DFH07DRAFT_120063 [Mycena maculata]